MAETSRTLLRKLAAVVCLLILLSSAAALFSIHSSSLNHTQSLKRFDEFKEAINGARRVQVSFKTQVQEWKNLLLRGQEAKDYDIYLERFSENERLVNQGLSQLFAVIAKLGIDPEEVKQLQTEHNALGSSYREALGKYRQGDSASILAVDRAVRGIDRKMNDDIDALVEKIDAQGDAFLEKFSAEAKENEKFFRNLLLGLSVLTGIATFTFIFQALRWRKIPG